MSEDPNTEAEGAEETKSGREKVGDGIKQGLGVLSAFKDALEETIHEARERGDLSTDRAKEVMKDALDRAQSAAEGARERIEFANQGEVETLKDAVASIRARVGDLEESVFGRSKGRTAEESNENEAAEEASEGASSS